MWEETYISIIMEGEKQHCSTTSRPTFYINVGEKLHYFNLQVEGNLHCISLGFRRKPIFVYQILKETYICVSM
jgi:hypothetical protein